MEYSDDGKFIEECMSKIVVIGEVLTTLLRK